MKARQKASRLAKPPLGQIALNGPADPPGGRESDSNRLRTIPPIERLDQHRASSASQPLRGGEEVGPLPQSFNAGDGFGQAEAPVGGFRRSCREALAPAGPAARDNPAATVGRHPRAKAMPALAHQSGWLEGPFHGEGSGRAGARG